MFRTSPDHHHDVPVAQLLWAGCAAVVLLFIFFAALDAFDPGDVLPVTVAVVALAALWLAHEWGGLWRDERRDR